MPYDTLLLLVIVIELGMIYLKMERKKERSRRYRGFRQE